LSEAEGWAAGNEIVQGADSSVSTRGILLDTNDGGQTWRVSRREVAESFFYRVYFSTATTGWLFTRDAVLRSEDRGRTWHVVLRLS
jgi:photosystem II stability/assembly factor-like uncharacterized protein